jgi:hypothetical protein
MPTIAMEKKKVQETDSLNSNLPNNAVNNGLVSPAIVIKVAVYRPSNFPYML